MIRLFAMGGALAEGAAHLASLAAPTSQSHTWLLSGLLLFLPAVWGMFIVNNCRLVVDEEMGKDQGEPDDDRSV